MNIAHLKKGDIVDIDHARYIKNGLVISWQTVRYKYIGKRKYENKFYFVFENINYKYEHFRMSKGVEDYHILLRKIEND